MNPIVCRVHRNQGASPIARPDAGIANEVTISEDVVTGGLQVQHRIQMIKRKALDRNVRLAYQPNGDRCSRDGYSITTEVLISDSSRRRAGVYRRDILGVGTGLDVYRIARNQGIVRFGDSLPRAGCRPGFESLALALLPSM